MVDQYSTARKFLIIADSHAKHIQSTYTTSSFTLVTKCVRGLKWIDNYDRKLCVYTLLSSPDMQSFLTESSAVLFMVATNSVRIMPATQIIRQIKEIVLFLQQYFLHLNQPEKITMTLALPCLKTTCRFSNKSSLISNIS
jgi:hypothetical protein